MSGHLHKQNHLLLAKCGSRVHHLLSVSLDHVILNIPVLSVKVQTIFIYIYLFTYLLIYLFIIYIFIYLYTYFIIYLPMYLFTYVFTYIIMF